MTEHVCSFQAVPVQTRRRHSVLLALFLILMFPPIGILYLLFPRGTETEIRFVCPCGGEDIEEVEKVNYGIPGWGLKGK